MHLATESSQREKTSILASSRQLWVCHIGDIAEREARGFDPCRAGWVSMFIVKRHSALYAYRDLCPHYGTTALPWKRNQYLDKAGDAIVCAAHGARFDIATGLCISGPCLGESLSAVKLTVGQNGEVFADFRS